MKGPLPKRHARELAALGGRPLFDRPLHVGRPNLGDRELLLARIDEALDRRVLTNQGPFSLELEAALERATGAGHVQVVSNATVGLQIVARAMGLQGEVVMPAFTFVGSAHAFEWIGLTPVFCDILDETMLLDPAAVEAAITPRTSAILGVHLYGRVCDVAALAAVAERHGVALLLDAAQALGSTRDGQAVGTFGDAEVLSFHATKIVNSFEGGAIATGDRDLAERFDLARNFGFADWDTVESAGTNGKMSEAAAAMGLTSLAELDRLIELDRRNARRYAAGLDELEGIGMTGSDLIDTTNAHYVVARVDQEVAGVTRDRLAELLQAEGILARRYFHPGVHHLAPYRDRPDHPALPVTDRVASEVLCLPTGETVGASEIDAIVEVIGFILANSGAVAEA